MATKCCLHGTHNINYGVLHTSMHKKTDPAWTASVITCEWCKSSTRRIQVANKNPAAVAHDSVASHRPTKYILVQDSIAAASGVDVSRCRLGPKLFWALWPNHFNAEFKMIHDCVQTGTLWYAVHICWASSNIGIHCAYWLYLIQGPNESWLSAPPVCS